MSWFLIYQIENVIYEKRIQSVCNWLQFLFKITRPSVDRPHEAWEQNIGTVVNTYLFYIFFLPCL